MLKQLPLMNNKYNITARTSPHLTNNINTHAKNTTTQEGGGGGRETKKERERGGGGGGGGGGDVVGGRAVLDVCVREGDGREGWTGMLVTECAEDQGAVQPKKKIKKE